MGPSSLTTQEAINMRSELVTLKAEVKRLTAELNKWKPVFESTTLASNNFSFSSGVRNDAGTFENGETVELSSKFLSTATPEDIQHVAKGLANIAALHNLAKLTQLIEPEVSKLAHAATVMYKNKDKDN